MLTSAAVAVVNTVSVTVTDSTNAGMAGPIARKSASFTARRTGRAVGQNFSSAGARDTQIVKSAHTRTSAGSATAS